MGRRNLTDGWKYELHLREKTLLSEIGKKNQAHGKTAPGKTLISLNDKSVLILFVMKRLLLPKTMIQNITKGLYTIRKREKYKKKLTIN